MTPASLKVVPPSPKDRRGQVIEMESLNPAIAPAPTLFRHLSDQSDDVDNLAGIADATLGPDLSVLKPSLGMKLYFIQRSFQCLGPFRDVRF